MHVWLARVPWLLENPSTLNMYLNTHVRPNIELPVTVPAEAGFTLAALCNVTGAMKHYHSGCNI